jgi:hypothetical protein
MRKLFLTPHGFAVRESFCGGGRWVSNRLTHLPPPQKRSAPQARKKSCTLGYLDQGPLSTGKKANLLIPTICKKPIILYTGSGS